MTKGMLVRRAREVRSARDALHLQGPICGFGSPVAGLWSEGDQVVLSAGRGTLRTRVVPGGWLHDAGGRPWMTLDEPSHNDVEILVDVDSAPKLRVATGPILLSDEPLTWTAFVATLDIAHTAKAWVNGHRGSTYGVTLRGDAGESLSAFMHVHRESASTVDLLAIASVPGTGPQATPIEVLLEHPRKILGRVVSTTATEWPVDTEWLDSL